MGAGEDDGVDPIAVGRLEHRLRPRRLTASTPTASPASLASASSTSSGEPWRMIVQSAANSRGEVVDIGLAHRRLGAEHADHPALRHFGRGLDRRDRADDRQVERRADMIERDGRGGVAGDDRRGAGGSARPAGRAGPGRAPRARPRCACRRESRRCRRHRRSARWAAARASAPAPTARRRRNRRTGWGRSGPSAVIASSAARSNPCASRDCFAPLAMTAIVLPPAP